MRETKKKKKERKEKGKHEPLSLVKEGWETVGFIWVSELDVSLTTAICHSPLCVTARLVLNHNYDANQVGVHVCPHRKIHWEYIYWDSYDHYTIIHV